MISSREFLFCSKQTAPIFMNHQVLLPAWLKYSRNNLSVIFDMKGNIKDCSGLLCTLSSAADKDNITAFFSEDEIIKLWNLLYTLNIHNNIPTHFVSHREKGISYQWEFLLYNENHIIGIAQRQNIIKRSIESMINADHLIEGFMDNCPASAWICDTEGRLLVMNKYYLSFTGLTVEDFGKTLWEIFPQQHADHYFHNNNIVLETNKVLKTEELSVDQDGNTRNFLVYKFPLPTVDHKILIGGWAVDITERKKAEQKIFEHNIKLKELAFLQSHEVRRPLANMLGLIELIKTEYPYIEDENLKNMFLYIQLSATELDNEIRRVIDKLQEE